MAGPGRTGTDGTERSPPGLSRPERGRTEPKWAEPLPRGGAMGRWAGHSVGVALGVALGVVPGPGGARGPAGPALSRP